jgi:imidazolonepropionase-like amidohydrolase
MVLDQSGGFDGPLDVHVAEARVVSVARDVRADDAPSVDFSGLWLLPGIFDCHDHLSLSSLNAAECLSTPVSQWALEAARHARVTLEGGVTFVRDLAGADAGIRDSIRRGYVVGPTLQVAVVLIAQTGGHGDGFFGGAGLEATPGFLGPDYPGRPPYLADGEESMRRVVRAVLRAGADWIKLATTGGLVSDHDEPLVPELTESEIAVAVSEAARKGKGVAAHAYGGAGLDNAVRAGVRSIEHGGFLTEEQATAMARRGCWLVPTLAAMRDTLRWAEEGRLTPSQRRKVLDFGLDICEEVRVAKEHVVRIEMGN